MKLRSLIRAASWVALLTALPVASRAGSLSSDIVSLFPKDTGEVAYVDLMQARQYPWFAQLKEQMLPSKFRDFEKFLSAVGVDANTQVTDVAWALVANSPAAKSTTAGTTGSAGATAGNTSNVPTSEEIVGIALGQFQPATADAYFASKKIPVVKVRTFSLFPFGGGTGPTDLCFLFIDSNTAAFGQRQQLEKMIGVRYGDDQGIYSNTEMTSLVNAANGSGMVWAVLNASYTRLAMQQLVPETAQFPAATQLAAKLKAMTISIKGADGVDARFEAVCGSADDANTFAALLSAGLMYQKYQAGNTNPDLSQLLDSAQIAPAGDRLDLKLSLTNDQMLGLIKRNTFAMKM